MLDSFGNGHSPIWHKYLGFAWKTVRSQGLAAAVRDLGSEVAFDFKYGTRTWRPRDIAQLETAVGSREDAVQYQGASPRLVRLLLAQLPHSLRDAWYVDYGCGKGRGLLLGMEAGFTRLAGVEFAPELAEECRTNLARARQFSAIPRPAVEVMDAAQYTPPNGPLVAFLYNPFHGETMRRVANRLTLRAHSSDSPTWVVYVNPQDLDQFSSLGWKTVTEVRRNDQLMGSILRPSPRMLPSTSTIPGKD